MKYIIAWVGRRGQEDNFEEIEAQNARLAFRTFKMNKPKFMDAGR